MKKNIQTGFTLIEIIVVIAIIAILSAVGYASFGDARAQARDKTRLASLQELQLALELYKNNDSQGRYPEAGCSQGANVWVGPGTHTWADGNDTDCPEYMVGLVPTFLPELPKDPKDDSVSNKGFVYKVSTDRKAYKVVVYNTVEALRVTSYNHEFARCPKGNNTIECPDVSPQPTSYAIYSAGAESW